MATTGSIFEKFKTILAEIEDDVLRKKIGTVILESIHKHYDDDDTIVKLKKNMDAQTQQFIDNLEKLENKKCPVHPVLAKAGNHH